MTENIIRLPPDPHREAQLLLPWYATGALSVADTAMVEAHLEGCPDCQADLRAERRLQAEVRDLPHEVEPAWAVMADRIKALSPPTPLLASRVGRTWRRGGAWAGWAMAAAIVLFVLGGLFAMRPQPSAEYRTLSAPPAAAAGNVVVIFRPEATEAQMRLALRAADARLVGGPTAADAYILSAPAAVRETSIERLRADPVVILAEPIDDGATP